MVVMMVMVLMLMLQFFHLSPQAVFLHCSKDLGSVQFRPRCCDQARFCIHALQEQ
jgi:hypothetical protein